MDDNYIINYFYSDKNNNRINRLSRYKIEHISKEIYEYLISRYNHNTTNDIHEIIYRIKNNIETIPRCSVCGNELIFKNASYSNVCSSKCAGKRSYLVQSSKLGIKNLFDAYRDKTIETMLIKYGVMNCSQSQIIKDKKKATFIKHYGVENNFCRDEIKQKNKELLKNNKEDILRKRRITNQEKYGVDYYLSLNKGKHLSITHKEKIGGTVKTKEFQEHRNKKLKENNTFSNSYVEEAFYKILTKKYNDVIRQYKSEKYPFNCDFYIPSIDTYIEIQGSQFHHFHPFDENDIEDINELERLRNLANDAHPQYKRIIQVWAINDVNKRNIAKENNLNFIEIYPKDYYLYKELNNIIDMLKRDKFFKKS